MGPHVTPPQVLIRCTGAPGTRYVVSSRTCRPFSVDCFNNVPDSPVNRINHLGAYLQANAFGPRASARAPAHGLRLRPRLAWLEGE